MPTFFLAENNACNQSGLHACQLECLPANSPTMGTKSPWNARHDGAARVYVWRGRKGWNSGASCPMLDFGGAEGAIPPPSLRAAVRIKMGFTTLRRSSSQFCRTAAITTAQSTRLGHLKAW
jgi:hypothetical protein